MKTSVEKMHRALGYLLWRVLLMGVVGLAIYVAGTRAILHTAPLYQDAIVNWVAEETGLDFRLTNLSGDVINFQPSLVVEDLQILLPEGFSATFDHASVTIDPWATLLAREIRLDTLRLIGISADVRVGVSGIETSASESSNQSRVAAALLSAFRKVTVEAAEIWLDNGTGPRQRLTLALELRRSGSERQVKLDLRGPRQSALTLSGSGVGDIFQPLRFGGDLHGHLEIPDASWLAALLGRDFTARGGIDFWYHGDNQLPEMVLATELADISWRLAEGRQLQLDQLYFTAGLSSTEQSWIARLQSVGVEVGGADFSLDKLLVSGRDTALEISSTGIDLGHLGRVLTLSQLLPDQQSGIIADLAPSGSLSAVEARIADFADPLRSWSLTASARDISVQPRKKVPGLLGMDGTVVASETGATAWIDTTDFTLDLPFVYRNPIMLNTVRGQLSARWDSDTLQLYNGILQGEHSNHLAKVLFGMDIPLKPGTGLGLPLAMYLDVGVPAATTAARHLYIPYKIPPALSEWLDTAILRGEMSDISFIWRGGFKEFGSGRQAMQLSAAINEAAIRYQPDWPAISALSATLFIDTDRVSVWGNSGNVHGVDVGQVSVEVDAGRSSGQLAVSGNYRGEGDSAIGLLRQSPIYPLASVVLDDLQLAGPIDGQLDLKLDIRAPLQNPQIGVTTEFSGVRVGSGILSLAIDDVTGGLDYDFEEGFASRDLHGMFFDQALTAIIGKGESGLQPSKLFDARFSSRVSGQNLMAWGTTLAGGAASDAALLSGETELEVAISVAEVAHVEVGSSLEGLAIGLPAPYGKKPADRAPLRATLRTGPLLPWDIFWQGRGQARLFRTAGTISGVAVDLTPRTQPAIPPREGNEGVQLFGELGPIELDPWLRTLGELAIAGDAGRDSWPLRIDALDIQQLVVGTFAVEDITIDVTPFPSWYQLGINTAWLDAELTVPSGDRDIALIINALDYDQLADLNTVTSDSQTKATAQAARRPPQLPQAINVTLANLYYGGKALGAARFRLQSASDALVIDDVRGQLAGLEFQDGSSLKWAESAAGGWASQLTLNAHFGDVNRTFDELSIAPLATTRSGEITADLTWAGGPTELDLLGLSGTSRLNLREGSFLPVSSSATGAARVFSLLNLAGLFGRADVTRIFDPGVTFRAADGDFLFAPGSIQIPSFDISGTGGGFNFTSDIDLVAETIDGELVVTLPLVENIPWMAALIGGLPVAAGAYLLSKVFERQVKSLSSGVYSVTGDLYDPDVTFVRIFDAGSGAVGEPATAAAPGDDDAARSQESSSDAS